MGRAIRSCGRRRPSSACIPEGLILLTNVALALGVYKLAQQNTLVQEMYSIETLARVNLLCIDKTGTITDGSLHLAELLPLEAEDEQAVRQALCGSFGGRGYERDGAGRAGCDAARKIRLGLAGGHRTFPPCASGSGADFAEHGAWILGAPEVLAADCRLPLAWRQEIRRRQAQGRRVLLLAQGEGGFFPHGKGSLLRRGARAAGGSSRSRRGSARNRAKSSAICGKTASQ